MYNQEQLDIENKLNAGNAEEAFRLIVKCFSKPLYWHIRKMVIRHDDSDDILQNVYIKVWKNLAAFRGESRIYTWLYRICSNEIFNFLADKRKKQALQFVDFEDEMASSIDNDGWFNGDEAQKLLQKAILQLPDKQRIVFNLRYFEEMKYEAMSKILETSEGALKASYHHAVKKIENFLKTMN